MRIRAFSTTQQSPLATTPELPIQKLDKTSSWKKPLLYTTLALAIIGGGYFAYQSGLFSTQPAVPPVIPEMPKIEAGKSFSYTYKGKSIDRTEAEAICDQHITSQFCHDQLGTKPTPPPPPSVTPEMPVIGFRGAFSYRGTNISRAEAEEICDHHIPRKPCHDQLGPKPGPSLSPAEPRIEIPS